MLEEALIAFPGVACVVSHDRYFLNRVCTDILSFEGDGKIHHSVGDYDYYVEKRQRRQQSGVRATLDSAPKQVVQNTSRETVVVPAQKTAKPVKLSFKETRELEAIEPQILAAEAEIARVEALFASPDFHRTHATKTNELLATVAATKEKLAQHYARWAELEARKTDVAK